MLLKKLQPALRSLGAVFFPNISTFMARAADPSAGDQEELPQSCRTMHAGWQYVFWDWAAATKLVSTVSTLGPGCAAFAGPVPTPLICTAGKERCLLHRAREQSSAALHSCCIGHVSSAALHSRASARSLPAVLPRVF